MGEAAGRDVRRVSLRQYNRLKSWAERRPSVALLGEFSAGKSTLMNFLIEEDLLPTRATATELPPVWLTYGRRKAHWVDSDGAPHHLDLAQIRTVPMTSRFIRIHATAEILEHCDILDTPGISDPNLAVESWRYVAGQANMVLWCTSATQAWRETERSAWLSLPERLRKNSILVVTRADKLVTAADRDKVRRRLTRETQGLFARIVFMATHDAVQAKADLAQDADAPLWVESGAEALLDALAERFEAIYEQRGALLARYEIEGEGSIQARRSADVRAVQSSRAQAVHGSGAPHVLDAAARVGDGGPQPVRPVRPAGGTSRADRPGAASRSELIDRLRTGLGDDGDLDAMFDIASKRLPQVTPMATVAAPAAPVAEAPVADRPASLRDALIGEPPAEDISEPDQAGDTPEAGEDGILAAADEAESREEAASQAAADADAAMVEAAEEVTAGKAGSDEEAVAAAPDESTIAENMARDDLDAIPADDHAEVAEALGADTEEAAALSAGDAPHEDSEDASDADTETPEQDPPENLTYDPREEATEVPADVPAQVPAEELAEASGPKVDDRPLAADASAAETNSVETNAAETVGVPADSAADEEILAVAEAEASAPSEGALAPEVALWRAVVARHPEAAANATILAVIEEFLIELHALRSDPATAPSPTAQEESDLPAWRRLA